MEIIAMLTHSFICIMYEYRNKLKISSLLRLSKETTIFVKRKLLCIRRQLLEYQNHSKYFDLIEMLVSRISQK